MMSSKPNGHPYRKAIQCMLDTFCDEVRGKLEMTIFGKFDLKNFLPIDVMRTKTGATLQSIFPDGRPCYRCKPTVTTLNRARHS